ncbi:MAG: amidohydrolase, partial [Tissierellia bacterium]|nr:amidohydrolase [Tissierellia bacterium]
IVKSITQAHGGKAEIEFKAFANPVINDEASSLFAAKIAKNIVGEDNVITNQEKALGADDFADFQAVVPGVYAHIGSRDPQDKGTHYPHHNERFNIDDKCLLVATNFYIQYALEYLNKSN